jgi:RHS repeat-associated protein
MSNTAVYPANRVSYDFNNRMTSTSALNPMPSDYYDFAGNVEDDGVHNYLYDAEGRLCAVGNLAVSGGGTFAGTQYIYDAEGRRVAKGTISQPNCDQTSNGFQLTSTYVLDQEGRQVSELDGQGNWQHTNVFVGGQLLATYDTQGLHFDVMDPLGTKRVQASASGQMETNCTSMPFGDSDSCFTLGQVTSPTEYLFTGKGRDQESGLDYFGARYYQSSMGRWMSPDWAAKPEAVPYSDLANPQSLNLYSYAGNNPLSRADADGHFWQELGNFFKYGHYVNNAGLENALQKDAQKDLAEMAKQGVTINGKSSGQMFSGLTNRQIVDGYGYVEQQLQVQKMANQNKADVSDILGALNLLPGGTRPFTGRTDPANLNEQLAMGQAKSNPGAGTEIPLKGGLKDPNYPGSDGWVKMRQNVNGTEVHYVRNVNTGEVADFKFK